MVVSCPKTAATLDRRSARELRRIKGLGERKSWEVPLLRPCIQLPPSAWARPSSRPTRPAPRRARASILCCSGVRVEKREEHLPGSIPRVPCSLRARERQLDLREFWKVASTGPVDLTKKRGGASEETEGLSPPCFTESKFELLSLRRKKAVRTQTRVLREAELLDRQGRVPACVSVNSARSSAATGRKRGPALPAPALLTRSPSKDDAGANPSGACRAES
jgi:hypothetical protein